MVPPFGIFTQSQKRIRQVKMAGNMFRRKLKHTPEREYRFSMLAQKRQGRSHIQMSIGRKHL